ncbi:hypothetical protein ACHAQA_008763 [Verticillium albo-atrum]
MAETTPELPTIWNDKFVEYTKELHPTLHRWNRKALRTIRFESDDSAYFGIRPVPATTSIQDFEAQTWGSGDDFILDFGLHMVGYLSMRFKAHGAHMDSPCRLRLTFGESPLDVTMGMDGVKTWISTAWLPDEVINIDNSPSDITIPRRHAFRYLRVEVLATSPKFKISLADVTCACVSAVPPTLTLEAPVFNDPILRSIDHVSIATLRDCMQAVFEDGPRRDRRLWLGDLRLQALANYATIRDFRLVKRCIFQFAAVPRDDGSIPACIFDSPDLVPSTDYIVDYDALFAAVVDDYVSASGDVAAGEELWPTVLGCLKRPLTHLNPETGAFDSARSKYFKFLDWQPSLDRDAGSHGVLLYCLKAADRLAARLGKPSAFGAEILRMTDAARHFLSADGTFVSGPQRQQSFASAAWLTLSGAFPPETARAALLATLAGDATVVRPLTPYLWHHVCDALATVGCADECLALVKRYWGGMLRAGADTFWEAFDPEDARASPYGDVRNNSFCHAWSCTPAYLLRVKLRERVIEAGAAVPETTMEELDQLWIAGRHDVD